MPSARPTPIEDFQLEDGQVFVTKHGRTYTYSQFWNDGSPPDIHTGLT